MEIEVKVKVNNPKNLKEKISQLGAKYIGRKTNIDVYFSVAHRDFLETKECLRIREIPEQNKCILTYKGASDEEMKNSGHMWKMEEEVEFQDAQTMKNILLGLDCTELTTVHKIREYYRYGSLNLQLDEIRGIGYFLEIEYLGQNRDIAEEEIWKVFNDLGFSKNNLERDNYRDLVLAYEQNN